MPAAVVTVMSTVPAAVAAGLCATICVAVSLVMAAARAPKSTAVALARFVPTIVTGVPPLRGPVTGLIDATTGTLLSSNRSSTASI